MAAEVETLGALFVTDTGKISEVSAAEGTGDKVEGAGDKAEGAGDKAEGAGGKAVGSKDGGNSGKLEDTAGKEGLKLGYCIGCCMDEGIAKPGGGR
ncbi:hypothetical protein CR513_31012, partial [Mucuna pruriens]